MGNEWIDNYLNDTEAIRKDYYLSRVQFGYNNDTAEAAKLNNKRYYAFICDEELRLFVGTPIAWKLVDGKIPMWERRAIPVSNIQYFYREGDVFTETKISGGGSSGVNLSGAIIGGLIGGAAGAIVGGQCKINSIQTETIRHDERKTILVHDGGKAKLSSGEDAILGGGALEFAHADYDALMKLIPDKELSVVQQRRAGKTAEITSPKQTAPDVLRELKTMLDEGLISQEEYDAKKTEILGRM